MLFRKVKQKVLHEDSWLKVEYRSADVVVRLYGRLNFAQKNDSSDLGSVVEPENWGHNLSEDG
ncbi:MAG: hypothetical protein OXT74_16565 [Candidatus Poribacteria bacterium]|nr:hypothetical protein [Candidatus Poribacteria bacterium]